MKVKTYHNPAMARHAKVVDDIAKRGVGDDARLIYSGRNNVYVIKAEDSTPLNVKQFRVPSTLNSFVYTNLRTSKARRSLENALRLKALGVESPTPVAYIEKKNGVRLRESYYISLQVDADDVRQWWEKPDAKELIHALGHFLAELHAKGIFHKDFSPGNVLYTRDEGGAYHFQLIDLNRMKFGVFDHRTQMRNFRSISLEAEHTRELAREYAVAAGLDIDTTIAEAEDSLHTYLSKKRRLKRIKNLFKHKK
jgi:tRNA A-37 threonylcarbamoyl transferase component Bud32